MELVGKSKVTRLNAKNGITCPLIRLPKAFANEIGSIVKMYEIAKDSSRALLITSQKSSESKEVIQPEPKVTQLDCEKGGEERLIELESEINDLRSLLLLNESDRPRENIKQKGGGRDYCPLLPQVINALNPARRPAK